MVPDPDGPLKRIGEFASTVDGYRHWGSFEKCAETSNAERHDSLTNLRTWRRWRHFGDEPDAEAQEQWRGLVREIRRFVQEGNVA